MPQAEVLSVLVLSIAIASPFLALAAWRWLDHFGVRLLPRERFRIVPWTVSEVLFAILVFLFLRSLVSWFLDGIGFYQWIYPSAAPDSGANLQWKALPFRKGLWSILIAFPLQMALILLYFRAQVGARPYQLGLTVRRAGANVIVGFLAWLMLAPLVLFVNLAVSWWYHSLTGAEPEEHPLAELGKANLVPVEWLLVILTAVVIAPVLEEFLYRGVLQPWVMRRSWCNLAAVTAALFMALYERAGKLQAALQTGDREATLHQLAPAAFVLLLAPGWILAERAVRPWLRYPRVAGSIYATSLLFAASHSFAWPTPVPLFVLSLGLGFLAYRTRSLVAPIVLHMLFNSIATLVLFFTPQPAPPPPGPTNGKGTTSAIWRSAPDSTSTSVSAASLPRRA